MEVPEHFFVLAALPQRKECAVPVAEEAGLSQSGMGVVLF